MAVRPDPELLLAVPEIPKGQHLTGSRRAHFIKQAKPAYDAGHSIRAIAAQATRSYGFVQRTLAESGIALRPRGSHGPRGADRHPRPSGGPEPCFNL
ncbi:helix-turn-helix domain-containing protein [Streptomyces lydicus]|uniref:helix-turn-helix domain-containing protein n=1 Tax=Streptomyces lydicus TaxID=47763 RepID=UPI0037CE4E9A